MALRYKESEKTQISLEFINAVNNEDIFRRQDTSFSLKSLDARCFAKFRSEINDICSKYNRTLGSILSMLRRENYLYFVSGFKGYCYKIVRQRF